MNTYAKALVAIVGSAVTAALGIFPAGSTVYTVLTILSAAITAAAVYLVPNAPDSVPPPAVRVKPLASSKPK